MRNAPQTAHSRPPSRYHYSWGALFIWIASLLIGALLIILNVKGFSFSDHSKYHFPSILRILGHWPMLDIGRDTMSAIAPGYYYFLATISFVVGDSELSLRLANLVISSCVPVVLFCYAIFCRLRPIDCIAFVLPVLLSSSFVKSSIWIMTDNASLLLVILSLILILEDPGENCYGVKIGILVSIATFVRQLNFWLVSPALAGFSLQTHWLRLKTQKRFPNVCKGLRGIPRGSRLVTGLFLLLPFFVLISLFVSWDGLVPQGWTESSVSLSSCPIAYILSGFSIYGSPYILCASKQSIRSHLKSFPVKVCLVIGLAISLISPTSYSLSGGRWGGIFWEAAKRMPVIMDRSIVFMLFSPLGAVVIWTIFHKIWSMTMHGKATIWLLSLVSWSSTFIINRQVFHRYFETQIMVFILIGMCIISKSPSVLPLVRRRWPIVCLSIFQTLALSASLAS